jgi:hypothetical protein
MDERWHFNHDLEEMKKRVDKLERDIYWLNKFMREHKDKKRVEEAKNDYDNKD